METAVYNDFERWKGKPKKKHEAGIVGTKRNTEAKETTATDAEGSVGLESALLGVDWASANEERACGQPDEEIWELAVERIPPNPRMVLAAYEVDGRKEVVRVWVGINRNFKVKMKLMAQRGATE